MHCIECVDEHGKVTGEFDVILPSKVLVPCELGGGITMCWQVIAQRLVEQKHGSALEPKPAHSGTSSLENAPKQRRAAARILQRPSKVAESWIKKQKPRVVDEADRVQSLEGKLTQLLAQVQQCRHQGRPVGQLAQQVFQLQAEIGSAVREKEVHGSSSSKPIQREAHATSSREDLVSSPRREERTPSRSQGARQETKRARTGASSPIDVSYM